MNYATRAIGNVEDYVRSAARFLGSRTFPVRSASAVVNAASPVALAPSDIVKRGTATWDGLRVATIGITEIRRFELVAYKQAARDDGETQTGGREPRVLTGVTYFCFDASCAQLDPEQASTP